MRDTECRKALSKKLNRLSEIAARDSKVKFTSLAYLLTKDFPKVYHRELNQKSAAAFRDSRSGRKNGPERGGED